MSTVKNSTNRILIALIVIIHTITVLSVLFGAYIILLIDWYKYLHISIIFLVILSEMIFGECLFTTLEKNARKKIHNSSYEGGFIKNSIRKLVGIEIPKWVFVVVWIYIITSTIFVIILS
jgi:hypothetical protein